VGAQLLAQRLRERAAAHEVAAAAPPALERLEAAAREGAPQPPQALAAHAEGARDLAGGPPLAQERDEHAVALERDHVVAEERRQVGAAEPGKFGFWGHGDHRAHTGFRRYPSVSPRRLKI